MNVKRINLPSDTVCPYALDSSGNRITIGDGVRPVIMSINTKTKGGRIIIHSAEVRCSRCKAPDAKYGVHHTREHFKGFPVYDQICQEYDAFKSELELLNEESSTQESETQEDIQLEFQETDLVLDQDQEEIHKAIHDAKYELDKQGTMIANLYQETVIKSTKQSPKYSPSTAVRDTVWRKKFRDTNKGLCPICEIHEIKNDSFIVGHIFPRARGGRNTVENFMPICFACNSSMSDQHLYYWAWTVYRRMLWPLFP